MNVEANEYSKSGTDDQAARHDETAYDPSTTDPDTQREDVGANSGVRTACWYFAVYCIQLIRSYCYWLPFNSGHSICPRDLHVKVLVLRTNVVSTISRMKATL